MNIIRSRTRRFAVLGIALCLAATVRPVLAQESSPALVEAARKEGKVMLYSGLITPTLRSIKAAFEKKYPGITLEVLSLSTAPMMNRITSETAAGRHLADVVAFDSKWYPQLLDKGLFARYDTPQAVNYDRSRYSQPPGYWIEAFPYAVGILYNRNQVPPERVPRSFEDLLKPEWKNKMAVVSPATNELILLFAGGFIRDRGEAKAFEYFRALAAQKVLTFGPSGIRVSQGVASGEFPVGIGFVSHVYSMDGNKNLGFAAAAPVYEMKGPGAAVMAKAPQPNAARLLVDFFYSREAQELITRSGYRSYHKSVKPPQGMENTRFIEAAYPDQKESEALRKKLVEVFGQ